MTSRLRVLWSSARDGLWLLPALLTIALCAAAVALLRVDRDGGIGLFEGLLFGGDAESARALLSAVAGGLVTVTGVVFSVTIVALELSSSQYTPRVLPNFMSDRANQIVIGVLLGTFTYSLLVLRVIDSGPPPSRFVPRLAITGGMILALLSVAMIIFFINHAAHSIQVASILQHASARALRQIDRLFPEEFGRESTAAAADEVRPSSALAIRAPTSGYLQAIDEADVFAIGHAASAVVKVVHRIGSFVLEGQPLAFVEPSEALDPKSHQKLLRAFVLGHERTHEQDYELTLIEISDVAVRALSPGVNDPTTAQHCIDRLAELLLALARRHAPTHIRTKTGRVHVIVKDLPFEVAVHRAFAPIVHFGAGIPMVRTRLLERLDALVELVPPARRQIVAEFRERVPNG